MRGTVVGLLLAVAFLAALFAMSHYAPRPSLGATPAQSAAEVEQGFVGIKAIGAWQLVCLASPEIITPPQPQALAPQAAPRESESAAVPHSAPAEATPPPAAQPVSLGRCRVTVEYRRKTAQPQAKARVFAAISFRLVGRASKLLMVVRVPPIAKAGDPLVLKLGGEGLAMKIASCQKGGCVAAGALNANAQAGLLETAKGQLILPPAADGKRRALPVPMAGLSAAITAMRRAES